MSSSALPLAAFPLQPGTKLPAIQGWQHTTPGQYEPTGDHGLNLSDDFLILDVDPRNFGGRPVDQELAQALRQHDVEPRQTRAVKTPGGGVHLYFRKPAGWRVKKNQVKFPGVDCLSRGCFVVGPGSFNKENQGTYKLVKDCLPLELPESFLAELEQAHQEPSFANSGPAFEDTSLLAQSEFISKLQLLPLALSGQRGDETTYKTACIGRDLGLSLELVYQLMLTHWNPRCSPPWSDIELHEKVEHAFRYGKGIQGAKSPVKRLLEAENGSVRFPSNALPSAFRQYGEEAARAIQCEPDFVFGPMLALSSILIGSSVRLEVFSEWKQYGNLYLAVVGTPGVKKSPALSKALTEPLTEIQNTFEGTYQTGLAELQVRTTEYKVAIKRWEEKQRSTVEKYESALEQWEKEYSSDQSGKDTAREKWKEKYKAEQPKQDPPPVKPEEPVRHMLFTSDATVEALIELQCSNPGIGMAVDELSGWFRSFNQYRPGGKGSDRSKFLSFWSNDSVSAVRKTSKSVYLPRSYVSICGGIQPEVLKELRKTAGDDDGMVERFLFCFPAAEPVPPTYDFSVSVETKEAFKQAVQNLFLSRSCERTVCLAPAALKAFEEQTTKWHTQSKNADSRMAAYYAKMPSQLARLVLNLHEMKRAAGETVQVNHVDESTVTAAAELADYFLANAHKALLNDAPELRRVKSFMTWMNKHGLTEVEYRTVQNRKVAGCLKASQAKELLQLAADYGYGKWDESDGKFTLGGEYDQ